jgi:hypothetical protein
MTSIPRGLGISAWRAPALRALSAYVILPATIGIGFYNAGVFGSGLFYAIPQ